MVAPLGGNSSFGDRSGMQPRDFHSRADGKVLYVGLSLEPQFVRSAYNSAGGDGGRTRTCTPLREEEFKYSRERWAEAQLIVHREGSLSGLNLPEFPVRLSAG